MVRTSIDVWPVVSSSLSLLRCRERVAFETFSPGCVSPWSSSCVFKLQPNNVQVHTTFTGGISEYNLGVFSTAINISIIYCNANVDPIRGVTPDCVTTVNGQLPTLWLPTDWTGSVVTSLDSNLPVVSRLWLLVSSVNMSPSVDLDLGYLLTMAYWL